MDSSWSIVLVLKRYFYSFGFQNNNSNFKITHKNIAFKNYGFAFCALFCERKTLNWS